MAGPTPAASDDSSPSRNRLLAGCAVVSIAAALVIGWLLLEPRQPREEEPPEVAFSSSEAPLEPAQQALDAWGRFAVTGDLEELDGHFHPDGPQYAQLRDEAPDVRARGDGGFPYSFGIEDASIEDASVDTLHAGRALLHVEVALNRPGEPTRLLRWELDLVHEPHHGWRVWTVTGP